MPEEQVDDKRIIEFLAKESDEPAAEVARLYHIAQVDLGRGASVMSYLPIFVIRNVQETLRRRAATRRVAIPESKAVPAPQ